jgi:ribosome assembly protein YihI (activator of Der GTPase)
MDYQAILDMLLGALTAEVDSTGDTSCIEATIDRLNELLAQLS